MGWAGNTPGRRFRHSLPWIGIFRWSCAITGRMQLTVGALCFVIQREMCTPVTAAATYQVIYIQSIREEHYSKSQKMTAYVTEGNVTVTSHTVTGTIWKKWTPSVRIRHSGSLIQRRINYSVLYDGSPECWLLWEERYNPVFSRIL